MTEAPPSGAVPRITVIVPVFNGMAFLPRVAPALVSAVNKHGAAELLFVDGGSTDASVEWLKKQGARVLLAHGATISAARNTGARWGAGALLSFVDADCLVPADYLLQAEAAMRDQAIAACGSRYLLPESPHWVERVWQNVHDRKEETIVTYLPAGNFVVRREPFESVGGFREDVITGEDADLGLRMTERGYRIYNTPSVWVRHLGNPRSLKAFFFKQRWHALGMFATVRLRRIDKPVAMTLLHLMLLAATAVLLVRSPGLGFLSLVTLAWLVPVASVAFRWRQGGQLGRSAPAAVLLYQVYYLARIAALWRIITGRSGRRA